MILHGWCRKSKNLSHLFESRKGCLPFETESRLHIPESKVREEHLLSDSLILLPGHLGQAKELAS